MTIAKQLKIKEFPFSIKDSDRNLIYREFSDGSWVKYEYADNKEIRYEDSTGYWRKREWDDGKEIYWEDSNGCIMYKRPKTDIQKAIDLLTKEGLIGMVRFLKTNLK